MSNAASLRKWVVENKIGSVGTFLCPYIHFPFEYFYVHRILNILFCFCVFYFVWLMNLAIQYHIDSTQEYEMTLKFERFSIYHIGVLN